MISSKAFRQDFNLVWKVMSAKDKRILVQSVIVNLILAFLELLGMSSLVPFLGVLSNPTQAFNHPYALRLRELIPSITEPQFIVLMGIGVVSLLIMSSLSLYFVNIYASRSSSKIVRSLSSRMYRYYLHSSYIYHLRHGSTLLMSRLSMITTLSNGFLFPLIFIIARGALCGFIVVTLLWVNPIATLAASALFGGCYLVIYGLVKKKAESYGYLQKMAMKRRNKLMVESLRGIKDVIVCRFQSTFDEEFKNTDLQMWDNVAKQNNLAIFPRYLLEAVAFGGIAIFTTVLAASGTEFKHLIGELTLFAVLGYKLLPAGQAVYTNLIAISGQASTFNELREDLTNLGKIVINTTQESRFKFASLEFQDVSFSYHGVTRETISHVSFSIQKGSSIGIVGRSGSGKTTLLDLMLGLMEPDSGKVILEDAPSGTKLYDVAAYTPQHVYILNTTLEENISMDRQKIDYERMKKALYVSCLDELVNDLPDGLKTVLNEDGSRLSGGQKQRVGIARAIYRNAPVLILDEASSALDTRTEALVFSRIAEMKITTIIVTHKTSNLMRCDNIIVIDQGRIENSGTYNELLIKSQNFRTLSDGIESHS